MGFVDQHITPEERVGIGMVAALGRGSYGLVSGLARELGESRPLFQLYRNAHAFQRGKLAGSSPFQLAGINTPQGDWLDWLDWLGLGRQAQPAPAAHRPTTLRGLLMTA